MIELIKKYGICVVEVGLFGWVYDFKLIEECFKIFNFVCFVVLCYVYFDEYIDYIVVVIKDLYE